ncbi:hypothetical protein CLOM621_08889 [Clostridium sp. M62/1]|nr:hypothetical protein CLOM621_08889 [Clostridium sp. M62/1]
MFFYKNIMSFLCFFVNIFYLLFYHPIIANYLYINIIIFSLFYFFIIFPFTLQCQNLC